MAKMGKGAENTSWYTENVGKSVPFPNPIKILERKKISKETLVSFMGHFLQ